MWRRRTDFNDVLIVCDDGNVEAHKIVLSSSSSFFEKELKDLNNNAIRMEDNKDEIQMKGMKKDNKDEIQKEGTKKEDILRREGTKKELNKDEIQMEGTKKEEMLRILELIYKGEKKF